jgi:predicted SprT family Zn-dependent metalloprotease
MSSAGHLGDSHDLSKRAREYAATVINGEEWPLTPDHVDLSRVIFETSTRMERQHGVCSYDGHGQSTIRLSETTYERAGFEALKETIRHELVHAYQQQTTGVKPGHGESFTQLVGPLDLSGRCSSHYETPPDDYKYRFYCTQGCGFIGGRHRWSKAVARAIRGNLVCGDCDSDLRVDGPDGTLEEVPEWRTDKSLDEYDLRYEFYCANCGLIGGRRQMCKTVRRVARGETVCQDCGSWGMTAPVEAGETVTPADL